MRSSFTTRGGEVQVRLEQVNSHIEITVSDTGAGIPTDFLPHVFDRFRQADAGIDRVAGGLGLGLAITRHLVELQGGRIFAASEGVGKGSTFRIELPRRSADTTVAIGTREHPRSPDVGVFTSDDVPFGTHVVRLTDVPSTCHVDNGAEQRITISEQRRFVVLRFDVRCD